MIIRLCLAAAALFAVTGVVPSPARAQPPGPGSACVTCLILQVPAAEAAALEGRWPLDGLTMVTAADRPETPEALRRLSSVGAEPGIVVVLPVEPAAEILAQAAVVVIRGVTDDDADVFALRKLATAARGARPSARVLVEGSVPGRALAYVDGNVQEGGALTRPTARALVDASLRGGAAPMLVRLETIDWSALATFAAERAVGTEVTAALTLTAEQIVARHQAQRDRQDQLVRRTVARGVTSLLFEVPGFVAPVTVTADTVIYRASGVTELEQRNIRVNGVSMAGGDAASPPRLPLIEPERIAVLPLVVSLGDDYSYSLAGRQRDDGGEVYVIAFTPRERSGAHGRAWIDADSFALRRLETVRSGLQGAIVSSEQHETFAEFRVGAQPVWLPVRVNVYQRYEGAGHRTPVHRTIETPEYDINPEDFDERLRAAYASPHLMLRETPHGLRYLLRSRDAADTATRAVAPRAGERIRAAVFGVLIDPNITTPLPFAGFSYVDLNLFDTGAQLNAFFGGTYGQVSWSVPSIGATRWQAHGRAFAIAVRFNDRAFREGIEQYGENITQRPAHVSIGVDRPLVRRLRMRLDYELDYTAFGEADTTATSFVVPPHALVHGAVIAVEGESGPWSARAWWNPAVRQRWRPWGSAASGTSIGAADARSFQRFGIGAARTVALGGAVASRVEAAWMDGTDLDRFSRYSFDAFENRLRGYPTASIRFDRGGVFRTVTSVSGRGFRIDGFADVAAVRDPGFGERLRGYPGVGAAVEVGGPFRTLWAVEWAYGVKARRSDGGTGTQAVRVTAYRTF